MRSQTTGVSLRAAKALAEKFPWGDYRSFVDIGAAQGVLPVCVASMHQDLAGGGFDLPPLQPVFEKYVAERGLSNRLRFYPGDLFKDPLPLADVLIFDHVLHNWNVEEKQFLLKKAYGSLTDEGALIVYEALIDDESKNSVVDPLTRLIMLLENSGGFDFSGEACTGWIKTAGFREASVEHLAGPEFMVVGIK